MNALQLALAVVVSGCVCLLVAIDAGSHDLSRGRAAVVTGGLALAASLVVLAADGALVSAYVAVTGAAVTPLELLGLTTGAVVLVAAAVLSGYGLLARIRRPA